MKYEKPVVVAQNKANGSYAMGCPEKNHNGHTCANCEIRS